MKRNLILFLGLFVSLLADAQGHLSKKGELFFYWGYNRAWYTSSDFHISGEGYDLSILGMRAEDAPTPFSAEAYLKPSNISKPQYNYRIGYYLSDRWSISLGMDHMKYYMIDNQYAGLEGYVRPETGSKYVGIYDGKTVLVPYSMLWVHHSDGLNYASVEVEYNHPMWNSADNKFFVDLLANLGAGVVIPKSFVRILGEEQDNKFHIAGGGPSLKVGGRFTFYKYFFVEASAKAGYVWMPNILVNEQNTAKARQHFGWLQVYGALGFSIPLRKNDSEN